MSQVEQNPEDGNPFAAPGETAPDDGNPFAAPREVSPPPQGSAQFSLKMMFGLIGGLAALLGILTALQIDTANIVAAFFGPGLAALMAIVLVSLTWSLTGRPRRRR